MSKWRGNPWAILITLSLGFFMTLLDLTIVNIAIPSMITALGASLDEILWVVNAYVLVLAVLLITAGRLGDLRGQRKLFVAGVVVFTLASLACGLAPNPTLLIAFRAVQGIGAAMLMPQTMAIIIGTFPAERRGTALGIWGAVAGLATVAGPTLGGVLVTYASWRWIFIVNVPIGVLVLVMTFAFIPDTRMERQHKLDLVGVGLATAGLFCLTFALIEGQRFSWNAGIMALFAAFVVFAVVFLVQQRGRQDAEPLVPFSLFKNRNFTVINTVASLVSVAILGFFLPITIYLQSVLGYSAIKAGLILAPMSLIALLLAPIAGRMSDQIGGKFILMTGLTLYAVGALVLTLQAQADSSWVELPAGRRDHGSGHGWHLGAHGDGGHARRAADAGRCRGRREQHPAPGGVGRWKRRGRCPAAEPAGDDIARGGHHAVGRSPGAVPIRLRPELRGQRQGRDRGRSQPGHDGRRCPGRRGGQAAPGRSRRVPARIRPGDAPDVDPAHRGGVRGSSHVPARHPAHNGHPAHRPGQSGGAERAGGPGLTQVRPVGQLAR